MFFPRFPPGRPARRARAQVELTESCAAAVYAAEAAAPASPLVVRPAEPDYGAYLNWLFHADATLTFPQTLVLRYRDFEPHKNLQGAAEDYEKWYHARLRLLDAALGDGREHLCGGRFTVADICVGYAVFLGRMIGIDGAYAPQTRDYLDRLVARPAFRAARAEEATSLEAFEAARDAPGP